MRNINYFCIVKHPKFFIIPLIICIISLPFCEVNAVNHNTETQFHNNVPADSIEISLLTCAPGTEVYSLYGHTAIRLTDYSKGIDIAINYGMFSFKRPFFVLRFIFGLTDYEMGIVPFESFYYEYKSNNRNVIQQVLNLTTEEKEAIISAIEKNYLPENRVYRYNYFYDNCTTRARDIIEDNINGRIVFTDEKVSYPSFRDMIHSFNEDHPWARFGNDMLLGVKADMPTDMKEHQFLPFNLKKDFDNAIIKNDNGTTRPLIKRNFDVISCTQQNTVQGFQFLRPNTCAIIILCIIIIITLFEFLYKKNLWLFDSFLMLVVGCIGLILFIMLFSKHPTTSTNLQILLFNPLPLIYIYKVAKNLRNNITDRFWIYASVTIILFLIAGIFQKYAEGVYILASSLLIRCLWRTIYQRNNDK